MGYVNNIFVMSCLKRDNIRAYEGLRIIQILLEFNSFYIFITFFS